VPSELAQQLADALRELLIALRAVLGLVHRAAGRRPSRRRATCRTSRSSEDSQA
jgi:hypothetical protein